MVTFLHVKVLQCIKRILKLLPKEGGIVRLHPGKGVTPIGCVVISYITWPFEIGINPQRMRGHTNAGEVLTMVETFQGLGFRVEICDWDNTEYSPPQDTIVVIDIHSNLGKWTLPANCIKVLHATGAHWSFQNTAEENRLAGVRKRRGVELKPRRTSVPTLAVKCVDHVVVLGNEFTVETFRFAGKPITRIPISSAYGFQFPEGRDYGKGRKKFLWIGSYGMVHKGLDLVLEAFAGMPDLELTVCGRPEKEDDFFRLYEKELKQTPNIHFHGWVDMGSPEFNQISLTHASVVYPSCSEGGGGSVIHCMHAGMIPVCTREASVDLDNFGVLIRDGSVSAVQEAVRTVASMSPSEVKQRAQASWEFVRSNHTLEKFRYNYQEFSKLIIAGL